jgi:hypothetical protein
MSRGIYDIDRDIEACVDTETGEVNEEALTALVMEREQKIDQLICWIKDMDNDITGIECEIGALKARKDHIEHTQERIKTYVQTALAGEKFKSDRNAVTYRKSSKVIVPDVWALPEEYVKYATPTPNKAMIKQAIQAGEEVKGASIEESISMIIK